LKTAFQFLRPIPAVLKNPIRNFFIVNLSNRRALVHFADSLQNDIRQEGLAAHR
jgi:hypothetical protein